MAGIRDCASTAGTAAAVEQPQLVAIRTEHQNVARTGIVDQHPAVVIFEEALERRRRQGCMAPRGRDARGSGSAQFGARKASHGRIQVLCRHLVEYGRGLLLVDRQVRRQRQVRAGVLHRPRPAFLNPAARSHRPGTGRGSQRLVVQHTGGGIVEDRGVAAPLPGIRLHARLVEIVERAELTGRHHPPARGSGRIGAAEMGAGAKRAVRAVVMRPDGIAITGTPRVRPLQDPDAAFEQAGEEAGGMGAIVR